jgi:hypothetical protein
VAVASVVAAGGTHTAPHTDANAGPPASSTINNKLAIRPTRSTIRVYRGITSRVNSAESSGRSTLDSSIVVVPVDHDAIDRDPFAGPLQRV